MPYGLAAPAAIIALPLAALLLTAGPRPLRVRLLAGAAAGFAAWWVLGPGELPDQTVRAVAVMATLAFAVLSRLTPWSVTHRALAAVGFAGAGVAACFAVFGWSWDHLHWWIAFRTGPALRLLLGAAAAGGGVGASAGAGRSFERLLEETVTTSADLFPAAVTLQVLASLAIAAALGARLVGETAGRPPGRFSEFRFSEHLGWLLVLAIATLLLPGLAPGRPVALNLLVVIGTLYGLRGLAVIIFGIRALRGGPLLYLAAGLALLFVLPGVVLLGVLDAGLNLRRRWLPPPGA